jgi:hypothetical protein
MKLPVTHSRKAGRPSRCPLCKGALLIARGAEVTYRLDASDEPARGRPAGLRLALAAVAVVVLVGGVAGTLALIGARRPAGEERTALPPAPPVSRAALPAQPAAPAARLVKSEQRVVLAASRPAGGLAEAARLKLAPSAPVAAWVKVPPGTVAAKPSLPAPQPAPVAKAAPPLRPLWTKNLSEEQLGKLLRQIPEVALENAKEAATSVQEARGRIQGQIGAAKEQTRSHLDGFVAYLEENRPDLAGLPFRKGGACLLEKDQARTLGKLSLHLRTALGCAISRSSFSNTRLVACPDPTLFWRGVSVRRGANPGTTQELEVRTLHQLLQSEHPGMRLSLVDTLREVHDAEASRVLARRALFDGDAEVRALAVSALADLPREKLATMLLEGMRYPWAPAAGRAAEALATLKVKEAIPRLVDLLNEPEPDLPFVKEANGKEVPMIRELVRINHLRNCLLCHAPSEDKKDPVRGVIPIPGVPVPSLADYDDGRPQSLFVRADVTYLRQDFSVLQPVENPGKWPDWQRFDYVVRTRPLTEAEQATWKARQSQAGPQQPSLHRQAVLFALCALTGQDVGDSPEAWRRLVEAPLSPARRSLGSRPCAR